MAPVDTTVRGMSGDRVLCRSSGALAVGNYAGELVGALVDGVDGLLPPYRSYVVAILPIITHGRGLIGRQPAGYLTYST